MPSRYNRSNIIENDSEFYAPLIASRNTSLIRHYPTQRLRNPTLAERVALVSTSHMWKYGNRFYNLANAYYGDKRYWWIIAWYNGVPTEAHLKPGDVIEIPTSIENVLNVLSV